jgi:hypothetical protein
MTCRFLCMFLFSSVLHVPVFICLARFFLTRGSGRIVSTAWSVFTRHPPLRSQPNNGLISTHFAQLVQNMLPAGSALITTRCYFFAQRVVAYLRHHMRASDPTTELLPCDQTVFLLHYLSTCSFLLTYMTAATWPRAESLQLCTRHPAACTCQ